MFSALKNSLDQLEIQYAESDNLKIMCTAHNGIEVPCFIAEPAEFGDHTSPSFGLLPTS